jgi:hypothetical protein
MNHDPSQNSQEQNGTFEDGCFAIEASIHPIDETSLGFEALRCRHD